MPSKRAASTASATYADIFQIFDTTKEWPSTSDPRMGLLMRYAVSQFKRVNSNGLAPIYGRYGFTQQVHNGFRKRGYVVGTVNGEITSRQSIIVDAIALLSKGEKLSSKVANSLRRLAGMGKVPPADEASLTKLGFRF